MSGILAPNLTPRPVQVAGVDAVVDVLSTGPRAQLRFPCGTGKTLIGALVAQRMSARVVGVLVPSLDLVAQTVARFQEWLTDEDVAVLAICSDPTVLTGVDQVRPALATTDPGRAGGFMEQHPRVLVVGTYHSSGALGKALRDSDCRCDLLILDEAHHLTGRVKPRYRAALDDELVPARGRLAMTATPVVLADADTVEASGFEHDQVGISMSDAGLFGPVAFTYSVAEAIAAGDLADYRVVVVAHVDSPSNQQRLGMMALTAAVRRFDVRRALSFHNRVADARGLAVSLNQSGGVLFDALTVTGESNAGERREALRRLGLDTEGVVRVVTAAHCLREGVDVPGVDAVMFAAPKSSTVHIIQAVGRCLRKAPGKTHGVIVIPVLLPAGADDDDGLAASSFAHIWKVLRALNAHDPRVATELIHAPERLSPPRGKQGSGGSRFEVLGSFDAESVTARLVNVDRTAWARALEAVRELADRLGGAHRITRGDLVNGVDAGDFITRMRAQYKIRVLDPEKERQCSEIPGWAWDGDQLRLLRALDIVEASAAHHGTSRDAATGGTRFPPSRRGSTAGRALAEIRRLYRSGELIPSIVARCEALPGWVWEPLTARDRGGVEAFAAFVAWEKTTTIPAGHLEDGFALAEWFDEKGYAQLAGELSPELLDELLQVAPRNAKGDPVFSWDVARLRYQIGVAALKAYAAGAGTCARMPVGTRGQAHGQQIDLYQWCSRVRLCHARGQLPAGIAEEVEGVPGWVWDARAALLAGGVGDPVRLPAHISHGDRRGASIYRCPCAPCMETSRAMTAEYSRQLREKASAHYRAHPEAGQHARRLLAGVRGATPTAVAAAAGMPAAMLRRVTENPNTPIPPRLGRRLAALTVVDVAEWVRPGTRGRAASRASEPGDPDRCVHLLDALAAAGWTHAQIAGELGHAGSTSPKIIHRAGAVTRAAQFALECLVEDVGLSRRAAS